MSELARDLIERAVLTERAVVAQVVEQRPSAEKVAGSSPVAARSVSPADVAATVPGVTVASAICGVSPPGRSRPSCTLPAKHDGRHSWEAGS